MSWIFDRLPEHGQEVIAVAKDEHGRRWRIRAHYLVAFTEEADLDNEYEPEADYSYEKDMYYCAEGWYEQINYWGELYSVRVTDPVICWMPMPALPPKEED